MGLAHDIIHFDGIVHYKPYPQLWKPPHDTRFAPPRLDLQQEIAPQVWECLGRSLVVLKSGDFMVRWWGVNGDLMGFNQSTWHDRWVWKWWNMKPWSPLTLWAMFHRENEDEPEGFIGGKPLPSLEIQPGVSSVSQGFISVPFVLHRKKYDKVPFAGNCISIFNNNIGYLIQFQ